MYYRLLMALGLIWTLAACHEQSGEVSPEVEELIEHTPPVEEMLKEVEANAENMTEEAPTPETTD